MNKIANALAFVLLVGVAWCCWAIGVGGPLETIQGQSETWAATIPLKAGDDEWNNVVAQVRRDGRVAWKRHHQVGHPLILEVHLRADK